MKQLKCLSATVHSLFLWHHYSICSTKKTARKVQLHSLHTRSKYTTPIVVPCAYCPMMYTFLKNNLYFKNNWEIKWCGKRSALFCTGRYRQAMMRKINQSMMGKPLNWSYLKNKAGADLEADHISVSFRVCGPVGSRALTEEGIKSK